jgi:hypothetical protein
MQHTLCMIISYISSRTIMSKDLVYTGSEKRIKPIVPWRMPV